MVFIKRFKIWWLGLIILVFWIFFNIQLTENVSIFNRVAEFQQGQVTSIEQSGGALGLIRLHVIANSDSSEDQALKYRVRDAIIKEMSPKFSEVQNIEDSRRIVQANLDKLLEVAKKTIEGQGYIYPVQIQTGYFNFPSRSYGDLVLPAGRYEAVRVIIGEGQGANWWCILFPPLCFINVSTGNNNTVLEAKADYIKINEYVSDSNVIPLSQTEWNQKSANPKLRYKLWELWKENFANN